MADTGYIWDEDKLNEAMYKHSVTFSESVQACEDENLVIKDDPQQNAERYMVLGRTEAGRLLQVICTEEDLPLIRLITAFDTQARWRRAYERR